MTCRRATKTPRRLAHQDALVIHSKTSTQSTTLYSLTHLRANLELTLKGVLRTKYLITKHWDGLETFSGVDVTSRDSIHWEHI